MRAADPRASGHDAVDHSRPTLAIVGQRGATNVGASFERAAAALGIEATVIDVAEAARGSPLIRHLSWRLNDHRLPRMKDFERTVREHIAAARPALLLSTGMAPLSRATLEAIRADGVITANFSTDDPWNRGQGSRWFFAALPGYDHVFTPRRANLEQLRGLGASAVHYLPFAYDEALLDAHAPPDRPQPPEVLFVGGGDRDRRDFMRALGAGGIHPTLVGDYWQRWPETRERAIGGRSPAELVWLTRAAAVTLILVRRANRDAHVMRSFEAAAAGGCLLVEDTTDHRDIFGSDGESVCYFDSPESAARRAHALLAAPAERERLKRKVGALMAGSCHRYRDRLSAILDTSLRSRRPGSSP